MENYLAFDENNNNIMPAIQSFPIKPATAELRDEATHHSSNHSHLNHHNQQQQQLQHAQQIQQQHQQIQIKFEQQVGASIVANSASNSSNASNSSSSSSSGSSCSGSRSNGASRTGSTSSRCSLDGTSQLTDIDTTAADIKPSPLASVVLQTTTTTGTLSSLTNEFGTNNHQLVANGTIASTAFAAGGPHLQSNNHNGSIITLNANGQPAKPRGRRKKIRTEPIRPICPQCDKQFSNQSALTKHKLTHSDERKFTCLQCSKAFKRQDHLTGHMQTHSNRKPFNCTIQGCDKTYCDARSLRRHKENIHHIVTPKENGGDSNHHQHHHNNNQHQLSATMKVEQQHNNNNHNHHHHHNHLQQQQPQINGQEQQQPLGNFTSNGASGDQIQSPNGIGSSLQTLQHHHHNQQQQLDNQNHNGAANQHQIQTSHHQQQQQQQLNTNQHQQQPASTTGVQQLQHTVSSTTLDGVGNCLQQISNRPLAATSTTPTTTPTATCWTSMDSPQYQNHQPNHHQHPQLHHPHSGGLPLSGGHHPHHAGHPTHNHQHNNLGGHYHHHHQAPYSADYATTQRFSFDFSHPQPHMTSPMDQLVSSNRSIPHSADSVAADSSQLVGAQQQQQGGYLTPTTLHPPTPNSLGSSNNTTASAANNNSSSNNNASIASLVSSTQFNSEQQQPTYKQPIVPSPSFVANSTNQQPSHLLRRRIQRLHSDGANYGGNALDDQLGRLEPIRQQPLMQIDQQQHYQQASYSADYASTQHFSFDFNHMTHMDQPHLNGSSNTIPHSADSITDSGLGLNVHYEQQLTPSNHHNINNSTSTTSTNTTVTNQHHHSQQQLHQNGGYLTPTTLLPPTPNTGLLGSPQFNNNTNTITATGEPTSIYHQQQQTQTSITIVPPPSFAVNSTNQQPSHLLRRRTQRLHSDGGSYTDDQSGRLDLIRQQQLDLNQAQQQQHYQQASYSADYASTQHFSFEDHNNQAVVQQQSHLLGDCIE